MPKMCTGMMARVRSVIQLSIEAGSTVSVAGSVSANTGRALLVRMAL
jgi:primosomal replication protein N